MSRPAAFAGALAATKTGYATRYVTPDTADLWRLLGYTVDGTTDPNPVPDLKEPGDTVTASYGASWGLDWLGFVDWHSRVREHFGYGAHEDLGVAGSDSLQVAAAVAGSYTSGGTDYRWLPGRADIVFLQTGVGIDQFYPAATTPSVPAMSYDQLTTILATLDGLEHHEVTSGGNGTWTNSNNHLSQSGGDDNAGTFRYTLNEGDYIELTVDGPAVDIAVMTGNGDDNLTGLDPRTRPAIVHVDGVEHPDSPFVTNQRVWTAPSFNADLGHRIIRLRGMGPGAHTIRLTAGSLATAGFLGVDYWLYPNPNPPIIVAIKEMLLDEEGADPDDWAAVFDAYDQAVTDHRTANPNTRLVIADLTAGWPHPAYLNNDDLHPNQSGHDWIARVAIKAMLAEGPAILA